MTLTKIRADLSAFNPHSNALKDFKATLELHINKEPQPSNEECLSNLQDDFTVDMLYSSEVLSGPTTLFRILRDYLILLGEAYIKHPEHPNLFYGIANSFLSEEDKSHAIQILHAQRQSKSSNNVSEANSTNTTPKTDVVIRDERNDVDNERKVAYNISQKYKSKEDKYSAKIGEDLEELFENYEQTCEDYKLTDKHKHQYVHNLFEGEAKVFFKQNVYPNVRNYEQVKQEMLQEFNNATRQNRVRQYLLSLTLNTIMKDKSCNVSAGLEHLRNIITKFAPQGPPSHRDDAHKVEYLCNAVKKHSWAKLSINNCYSQTPPWNFNTLWNSLDSAWLQEQRDKDDGNTLSFNESHDDAQSILWESQRMYGKSRHGHRKKDPFKKNYKSKTRCWNCNMEGHFSYNCPNTSRNMTKNVHNAIMKNPKKANKILFEICQQFDTRKDSSESESSDSDSGDTVDAEEQESENNVVEILHKTNEHNEYDSEDF